MKEDYVSFEIAKLLKEKGFDWECLNWYSTKGNLYHYADSFEKDLDGITELCSAPTLQVAMKWLREIHKIYIQVELYSKQNDYCFELFKNTHRLIIEKHNVYDTYDRAVEAAIKYCLTNLI